MRRFIFDDQARFAPLAAIEHTVASAGSATHIDTHLVGQQGGGIMLPLHQEMGEVLPHPLFGSKGYVAAAKEIEDNELSVAAYDFCGVGREI